MGGFHRHDNDDDDDQAVEDDVIPVDVRESGDEEEEDGENLEDNMEA